MNLDEIFKKIKKTQADDHGVGVKIGAVGKDGEMVEIDLDEFGSGDYADKYEVVKTVPLRPEWKKRIEECNSIEDKIAEKKRELKSKKDAMWGQIDVDMNEYSDKHYNEDTQEIEILAPKKESKGRPIKSPIQGLM